MLKKMIVKDEFMIPHVIRTEAHRTMLLEQRKDLHSVYTEIENKRVTIDDIVRIQKACKPEIPVPLERPDNPYFRLEELTNFHKHAKIDPSTELETIWRKTTHYPEQ